MFKNLKSLLVETRTCRRFQNDYEISSEILEDLVDMARITSSARNAQVLRYAIINGTEICKKMVPTYALGGSLKAHEKPQPHQAPTAYIVILAPSDLDEWSIMDIGIAAQTIQLGATEKGLAACIIGAFNGSKLLEILEGQGLDTCDKLFSVLRAHEDDKIILKPRLLLALGKSAEKCIISDIPENGKTVYFHENDVNIVPKRKLADIILLKA